LYCLAHRTQQNALYSHANSTLIVTDKITEFSTVYLIEHSTWYCLADRTQQNVLYSHANSTLIVSPAKLSVDLVFWYNVILLHCVL